MKRLKTILFSLPLSGILLMLFAIAIAVATFIENDFGTRAAKSVIFNAKWFELLLLLLTINLIGSVFKEKMYRKEKFAIFLFHISFIVILFGAAITRYISYEGSMHIREGKSSNTIVSESTYLKVFINDGQNDFYSEKKLLLAPLGSNDFSMKMKVNDQKIDIKYKDFYRNAEEKIVEEEGGVEMISLAVFDGKSRHDISIMDMEVKQFNGMMFTLNDTSLTQAVILTNTDSGLFIKSPMEVAYFKMLQKDSGLIESHSFSEIQQQALYTIGQIQFVISNVSKSAKIAYSEAGKGHENLNDALVINVSVGDQLQEVVLLGKENQLGSMANVEFENISLSLSYGSKLITLPFSLHLNDFQLDRYPGSNSPSSFASEVTVIDSENNIEKPYRIFMNNILNYGGYRFFQSNFDPDEKGTVLSVNHDFWGTMITYIGYLMMTIGMIFTLFTRSSRFRFLTKASAFVKEKIKKTSAAITLLFILLFASSIQLNAQAPEQLNIDVEHAAYFGEILIQDRSGRLEPISTKSSEILRKISRKTEFNGLTADQVFLGMLVNSYYWKDVPMIKVSHPEVKKIIGISGKYASFNQIVDKENGYKLRQYVDEANATESANRGKFEKDILAVDERVNISYFIYMGTYLTVFPKQNDATYKWLSPVEAWKTITGEDSIFVSSIFSLYIESVHTASESGNWDEANQIVKAIKAYQDVRGGDILPSETKIKLEIKYNNINIFNRLTSYYGLIGLILLILHFISILTRIKLNKVINIASWFIILGFVFHSIGLGVRWYISGHAPWSNAYESMVFIAWASSLSGILFFKRSSITLTATALLSALILSVAHLNWLDPEITNLVPVLKSYWLIIHVAIITSSYGFLGLGAILAFFNLLLMILRTRKNSSNLTIKIQEFSYIAESTLVFGLFLLTIGTFLGGVWANESWGRYWGWDPKETWALVTVLVYSFILHMRFIPGFRGFYAFNLAALVGYGSVLMTYFGVNYYLSGMHSYAAGDPVPVPTFVYYTVGIIFIIAVIAFIQHKRNDKFKSSTAQK